MLSPIFLGSLNMTVAELIMLLEKWPNMTQRVVINGYEGGHHDLKAESLREVKLKLNVNTVWYYGPHEPVSSDTELYDEVA